MKKHFALHSPGKNDARVLEAIKSDIRKYVKRERRKSLPAGYDTWEFICKVGANSDGAASVALPEIGKSIDQIAVTGGDTVYVEILAQAAHRPPAPLHSAPMEITAVTAVLDPHSPNSQNADIE